MPRFVICLIVILGLLFPALAQEATDTGEAIVQQTQSGLDDPEDTQPISKNPNRIPNRLERDDKRKDTLFHTPWLDQALEPWYEFKDRLGMKSTA